MASAGFKALETMQELQLEPELEPEHKAAGLGQHC